jgi:hypothetical protein
VASGNLLNEGDAQGCAQFAAARKPATGKTDLGNSDAVESSCIIPDHPT